MFRHTQCVSRHCTCEPFRVRHGISIKVYTNNRGRSAVLGVSMSRSLRRTHCGGTSTFDHTLPVLPPGESPSLTGVSYSSLRPVPTWFLHCRSGPHFSISGSLFSPSLVRSMCTRLRVSVLIVSCESPISLEVYDLIRHILFISLRHYLPSRPRVGSLWDPRVIPLS